MTVKVFWEPFIFKTAHLKRFPADCPKAGFKVVMAVAVDEHIHWGIDQ